MIQATLKASIGICALLMLSACATKDRSSLLADDVPQCKPSETRTCDKFADEVRNCTCEKGDKLQDMLDVYRSPEY